MYVHQSIQINRPRPHVYSYWRALGQLPLFMEHLVSITGDPNGVTHWTAKAPVGTVEWDAKIVEDKPNEMISWRSLDDADVRNSGAVRFFDEAGGTLVEVNISYDPPAGPIGALVARLFGEHPDQQIADDLQRLKQILETGEIIGETDGSDSDDLTLNGNTLATGGVAVENFG
jgi:uncharacterized membrane protein